MKSRETTLFYYIRQLPNGARKTRYKLKRDPPRRVLSSTDLDMNFDGIQKSSYWIAIYIKSRERRVTKRPSNVEKWYFPLSLPYLSTISD